MLMLRRLHDACNELGILDHAALMEDLIRSTSSTPSIFMLMFELKLNLRRLYIYTLHSIIPKVYWALFNKPYLVTIYQLKHIARLM